jgi:hypothetical protein
MSGTYISTVSTNTHTAYAATVIIVQPTSQPPSLASTLALLLSLAWDLK